MALPEIRTLRIGSDNYSYILAFGSTAVVIDACDAAAVQKACTERNLTITHVLSTHHHDDHTAGNHELHQFTGCTVAGADKRIPSLTRLLSDNENITVNSGAFTCIILPGHTKQSCAFYSAELGAVFTGDTLFYAGCGRLFEGTPDDMYHSLSRLAALPLTTAVYCGHEYTLDNISFAQTIEPDNQALATRQADVHQSLKSHGKYGPSTIALELATNPFMRTNESSVRASLGMPHASPAEVLGFLREQKNNRQNSFRDVTL